MKMLKFIGISMLLVFTALWVDSCGRNDDPSTPEAASAAATSTTVTIPQNAAGMGPAAYGTNPLVIAPGTMVTWVNNDSVAHTATSDSGVWDSKSISPGQSFSFTFNTPGSFPYHCTIHGAASMSGMIQVTSASPSPSPSATPTGAASGEPSPVPSLAPTPSATPTISAVPVPSVTPSPTPIPTSTSIPTSVPTTVTTSVPKY